MAAARRFAQPEHMTLSELYQRREIIVRWLRDAQHDKDQRAIGHLRLAQIESEILDRGGKVRRANPAWIDRVVNASWSDLEARIPPVAKLKARGQLTVKPYGCGVWGCVMPTIQEGTVLKITNDAWEARFVATVLQDPGLQMPGVVRYIDMVKLPMTYQRHGVYAIWREEAYDVGNVVPDRVPKTQQGLAMKTFSSHLGEFFEFADKVHDMVRAKGGAEAVKLRVDALAAEARATELVTVKAGEIKYRDVKTPPGLRMAERVQLCRIYAEAIAHGAFGQLIGRALADLINEGILLADVHEGNIGFAMRDGHKVPVITDPGLTVPLRPMLAQLMERAA